MKSIAATLSVCLALCAATTAQHATPTPSVLITNARGSQLRAVAQLYRALGGGWQLEPAQQGQPVP